MPPGDQHDIEAGVELGESGVFGQEQGRRAADSPLLPLRHGGGGGVWIASRLDLDEDQGVAAAGDNIDFTDRRTEPARENTMTAEAQESDANRFGPPSLALGAAAFLPRAHPPPPSPDRASARA